MPAGRATGTGRGLRTRLAIAFGITAIVVLTLAFGSVITGSLALLTDTAHALVDASGLLVALVAAVLLLRRPSSRRSWGFLRIEVIAALGQATLLLVVGAYAAIEGVPRLFEPPKSPPPSCSSSASSGSSRTSRRSPCSPRADGRISTCARPS